MNRLNLPILVLLILLILPEKILADGGSASVSADGAAISVPILTISKSVDMNFGRMGPSGSDGSCQLSTTNTRVLTNLSEVGNGVAPSSAVFVVTGSPGYSYTIKLPASAVMTGKSTGKAMTVKNFTARPFSSSVDGVIGTIGTNLSSTFSVGPTLSVSASQAIDVYSGDYEVNVAYN
jgi:hypothetical protein